MTGAAADTAIPPSDPFECRICWWVCDPLLSGPRGQVTACVSFAMLSDHWRCPECDADRTRFLAVGTNNAARETPRPPKASAPAADLARRLVAADEGRDNELRSPPVHHPPLPAGSVVVVHVGRLPGFGTFEQASLFSLMSAFASQAAARAVAQEALRFIVTPPAASQRPLLAGRRKRAR